MHFARFSRLRNEALRGVKQLEQQKPPNEDHEAQESFPSQLPHTPRSCKNDCPNQTTSPQGQTKWMLARMVAIPSQTPLLPVRKQVCAGACLEFAKHTQPPIPPILRTRPPLIHIGLDLCCCSGCQAMRTKASVATH